MTIKITQVTTSTGEIILTIVYDDPKGSEIIRTFTLRKNDLYGILGDVCKSLGRTATLTDAQQVIVSIVRQLRSGAQFLPANFDFAPYIGVELET
jgi:hypothetical protein